MSLKHTIIKKSKSLLGLDLLKQEAMLREALKEEGLNYKNFNIEINHRDGYNIINGLSLPIIYPKSFFLRAKKYHNVEKKYKFYFNGNMSSDGGRKRILEKFEEYNSKIIESNYGRSILSKNKFNEPYYEELSLSEFGLCPHHKNFIGNQETMWTYRFIECCMVKTLPIIFSETPLGKEFIQDFHYFSDEFIISNQNLFDVEKANDNYELAFKKFTLNNSIVNDIKNC